MNPLPEGLGYLERHGGAAEEDGEGEEESRISCRAGWQAEADHKERRAGDVGRTGAHEAGGFISRVRASAD